MTKIKIIRIFLEALIVVMVFFLIEIAYKVEFVRSNIGDVTFKYMNNWMFAGKTSREKEILKTEVLVYKIDQGYLENQGLLGEYGESSYGEIFPRSKLAAFVEKIDKMSIDSQPLALFIDYVLEQGSASYDHNQTMAYISQDDMVFLRQLAHDRVYTILLPKTSVLNFVERYAYEGRDNISNKLKHKIIDQEIVFVDVNLLKDDKIDYRYNPMMHYPNNKGKVYFNVALVGWQLRKYIDTNETFMELDEINTTYPYEVFLDQKSVLKFGEAIIKSNILYKSNNFEGLPNDSNDTKEEISYWQGLQAYSANVFWHSKDLKFNKHTIVMIGVDFQNYDLHKTSIDTEIPGVLVHANALKTVLFLDGSLEHLSWKWAFALVFFVFLLVTLLVHYVARLLPEWFSLIELYIELLLVAMILISLSSYILVEYGKWFNWGIPLVIWLIDDAYEIIREKLYT